MFRLLLRYLVYLTLASLPLTLLPFLHAFISGFLWAPWNSGHVAANTDQLLYETRDKLSDWGVGGGVQSFRQFQDSNNDFRLTRVNTHDWFGRLGYVLPNEFVDLGGNPDMPVDKLADLDHLMWDVEGVRCEGRNEVPKEQWLYLADFAWPQYDPWDAAFDEILQQAYVDPRLNQSGYEFAECSTSASFLCGVWSTRAPALVHFMIEDDAPTPEDIEEGLTYTVPLKNLRPVTARIIELPLEDQYSGLTLFTFPSEKEQLLAIMTGDRLYEQWEPYNVMNQMFSRFTEYLDRLWDAEGTFLHYLNVVDDWIREEVTEVIGLGPTTEYLREFWFFSGLALSQTLWPLVILGDQLIGSFLGRPLRGDEIMGDMNIDETPEDRFWDDMLGGFGNFMESRMAADRSASPGEGAHEPVTTA